MIVKMSIILIKMTIILMINYQLPNRLKNIYNRNSYINRFRGLQTKISMDDAFIKLVKFNE